MSLMVYASISYRFIHNVVNACSIRVYSTMRTASAAAAAAAVLQLLISDLSIQRG